MRRTARCILALAALLALSGIARAATLGTAPLIVYETQNTICTITNLGTKPVANVRVEVVQFSITGVGTVIETSGPGELAPLGVFLAEAENDGVIPAFRVCRFSAKGNGKNLRATVLVTNASGTVLDSQPAR